MTELFDAIYARWTAMMAGRILYNTKAPGESEFPYTTFSLVSDVPDWTFTEGFEDCLIQFNCFSDSLECTEVGLTFKAIKIAFDKFDLVVGGHTTISLERGPMSLIKVKEVGKDVWRLNVSYRMLIEVN